MTINSQQKSEDKLHSRSRGRTSSNSTETRYFPTALIVIVCYYTIRQVMVIHNAFAGVENILMNPLIFAGTHIGQTSWTNDVDREFHPSEA
jgi:hypothetical protein